MKKILVAAFLVLLLVPRLFAEAENAYLGVSDKLSYQDKNAESLKLLLSKLPHTTDPEDRAEIYWRLSRDTLREANDRAYRGAKAQSLIASYLKGEGYGEKAIEDDPSNPHGYVWKAANIGRWGETRGILASLSKADEMRRLLVHALRLDPKLGNAWFILSQLYAQVPGYPVSFGSITYAVSLARKALQTRGEQLADHSVFDVPSDYYLQLARHLVKRNWSAERRTREHAVEANRYQRASGILAKGLSYEGSAKLASRSDREEAVALVKMVAQKLELIAHRTPREAVDLSTALSDLSAWGS